MLNQRSRFINKLRSRYLLAGADAQLSFLAANRPLADPPDLAAESTYRIKHGTPDQHTRADEIADFRRFRWQSAMRTTQHPIKFFRQPYRCSINPARYHP